jgi:hypothetical protein
MKGRRTLGGGIDEARIVALCAALSVDDVMAELGCSRVTVPNALRTGESLSRAAAAGDLVCVGRGVMLTRMFGIDPRRCRRSHTPR